MTLDDLVDDLFGVTRSDRRGGATPRAPSAADPRVAVDARPLVVPGDTLIHEAAAMLGRHGWGESDTAVTVGGLVVDRLGRLPGAGETLTVDDVVVRVIESDDRAVRMLELVPPGLPAAAADVRVPA